MKIVAPVVMLALLALTWPASAHPLAPVALRLEQKSATEAVLTVKRSRVQPRGAALTPRLPTGCERVGEVGVSEHDEHVEETHRLVCSESRGVRGTGLGMVGISAADLDAVVVVHRSDGTTQRALLDRDEDAVELTQAGASPSFGAFVTSGIRHLLGGFDHLLFVVGLVLLMRGRRRVLLALTAFTAGHALSMGAASLGWVSLPPALGELAIAATLVWLAREILRREERPLSRPYAAALMVGLVHGLGFANAFSSAGLAAADLPLALGAFHVGIELGQLAAVAIAMMLVRLATRALRTRGTSGPGFELAAYGIGAVSAMWLLERAWMMRSWL